MRNHGRQRCRGFSLTEIAIVLAVLSLILGGLWTAGRSVQQSQRASETAKRITLILNGLREMFGIYPPGSIDFSDTGTLQTIMAANIIPSDMIGTPNDPSSLQHIWGGSLTLSSASCYKQYIVNKISVPECVSFAFKDIPPSACTELVTRLVGADIDPLLDSLSNGTGVNYRTPPITPATINSLCVQAGSGQSQLLKILYKLR